MQCAEMESGSNLPLRAMSQSQHRRSWWIYTLNCTCTEHEALTQQETFPTFHLLCLVTFEGPRRQEGQCSFNTQITLEKRSSTDKGQILRSTSAGMPSRQEFFELTRQEIFLQHVCPGIGCVVAFLMFASPLKVRPASRL